MPTAASPPLDRKWQPIDSPPAFWLLCLKSIQLSPRTPPPHLVVTLTAHCAVYLLPDWLDQHLSSAPAPRALSQLQRSAQPCIVPWFKFRLPPSDHTHHGVAAEGRTGAAGPVWVSSWREREAGLPGTVGLEQREQLQAQSIKTELFALWE